MLRLLGLLFLVVAVAALAADLTGPGAGEGSGFAFASLAERWAAIDLDSLIGFQSGLENRISPDAFLDYALPVLELPAAPALGALGAALLVLGAIGRRRT